jgi:3-deoxy-manno-octulosonate cytidylyltransferase (CMP-KDO synthetase)
MSADGGREGFGVVVPARYASSRLPGKPLLDVGGKPMVVRVLEVARASGARFVLVATDDQRIAEVVTAAGGEAILTSPDHPTGTDRLAEVARKKRLDAELVVVNLQGDEPALPASLVELVARTLLEAPDAGLATLATPLRERSEVFDPNVVKVVLDQRGKASYFSRAPIPWRRDEFTDPSAREQGVAFSAGAFHRHVGLYAYRVSTLHQLSRTPPAPTEVAESLEQLRALWLGIPIQVAVVPELPAAGVDTIADLLRVQQLFER